MYYHGQELVDDSRQLTSIYGNKEIIISILDLDLNKFTKPADKSINVIPRLVSDYGEQPLKHYTGNNSIVTDRSDGFQLDQLYEKYALMYYVRLCMYEAIVDQ